MYSTTAADEIELRKYRCVRCWVFLVGSRRVCDLILGGEYSMSILEFDVLYAKYRRSSSTADVLPTQEWSRVDWEVGKRGFECCQDIAELPFAAST